MKVFIALISMLAIESSMSAEILCVFPKVSYSHQAVYRGVTEKLLERGHKITVMSTYPSENEKNHENVTLIDLSFSVESFKRNLEKLFNAESFISAIFQMIDDEAEIVDLQLSSEAVRRLFNNHKVKFDLLLIEAFGMSPFHAFAELFNVPVVGIVSADAFSTVHGVMGNVINPIAHPDRVLPFEIAETFLQRLVSCLLFLSMKFLFIPRALQNYEPIMRKYFPKITKTQQELVGNVDLLLINAHPALGYIRPILPNTIPLGFLHIKPPRELPSELKNLVDQSNKGAIYMSFGTVVTPELAAKNFEVFLEAFSELPYDIFWKHDGEVPDLIPPNVHIRNWFPQSDLLAHKNVKLFISHGGQHSIEEAIMRHVPLVVCPFHGDQTANSIRMEARGISKTLNIHNKLSTFEIKTAVLEVINNSTFKENVVKLAELVDDVPMKSPDLAVWHIESILRNRGAKHLNYRQKEIPFYQYHYYDILLSVIALLISVLLIGYAVFKFSLRQFKRLDLLIFKVKTD